MTHIDMSQSAKSYFRARRYDPFPVGLPLVHLLYCSQEIFNEPFPTRNFDVNNSRLRVSSHYLKEKSYTNSMYYI